MRDFFLFCYFRPSLSTGICSWFRSPFNSVFATDAKKSLKSLASSDAKSPFQKDIRDVQTISNSQNVLWLFPEIMGSSKRALNSQKNILFSDRVTKWCHSWVALSRVGTCQDVPSSFRAGYIFEHSAVLTSFRTSFQGSETGLHWKVLDFSSTLLWKPVSEPVFIYQKPVYTRKYSKFRWSEMAPGHPGTFRPLRG